METGNNQPGPKDYCTVLSHFYRGELGRIMDWRRRLDVTTNWAIMGATALITFGFGASEYFGLPFVFANCLVFLLLLIEARRYRIYDAFRARVRCLEVNFILPVLRRQAEIPRGEWEEELEDDLLHPGHGISLAAAVLRRFRRNYVWIFLLVGAAWLAKAGMNYYGDPAGVGLVSLPGAPGFWPGVLLWVVAGLTYAALIGMTVAAGLSKDFYKR